MWPALERLLSEIDDANPGQLRRESDAALRLTPRPSDRAPDPLPVAIAIDTSTITVEVEGWIERFDRANADDPDDDSEQRALDLVAAVLFGRLRVHVRRRADGHVVARDFVFATRHGARVHRSERSWRWPWQRLVRSDLGNAIAVPGSRTLGDAGLVPRVPWSGTLAEPIVAPARAIAIDGELDLHPFAPREVKALVLEYIEVCKQEQIFELRIVHGKGIGALRRTVHALLAKHPDVANYRLGGMGEGSWGATIVTLRITAAPDP